jgi:phospholipid transport system substrate-binding protein
MMGVWKASMMGVVVAMAAGPAMAQSSDPAAQQIDALNNGLLAIMKAGKSAGQSEATRASRP